MEGERDEQVSSESESEVQKNDANSGGEEAEDSSDSKSEGPPIGAMKLDPSKSKSEQEKPSNVPGEKVSSESESEAKKRNANSDDEEVDSAENSDFSKSESECPPIGAMKAEAQKCDADSSSEENLDSSESESEGPPIGAMKSEAPKHDANSNGKENSDSSESEPVGAMKSDASKSVEHEKLQNVPVPTEMEFEPVSTGLEIVLSQQIDSPSSKRPTDSPIGAKSKRKKPNPNTALVSSTNRKQFQRLYSLKDEIAILEGLAKYNAEGVSAPNESRYDLIRENLICNVTDNQLQDKIKKMKAKYHGDVARSIVYSDSHNLKRIELSKLIWGPDGNNTPVRHNKSKKRTTRVDENITPVRQNKNIKGMAMEDENINSIRDNKNVKRTTTTVDEIKDISERSGGPPMASKSNLQNADGGSCMATLLEFIENHKHLITEEKMEAIEAKQKELRIAEAKLGLMKLDLIREEVKLILEALK